MFLSYLCPGEEEGSSFCSLLKNQIRTIHVALFKGICWSTCSPQSRTLTHVSGRSTDNTNFCDTPNDRFMRLDFIPLKKSTRVLLHVLLAPPIASGLCGCVTNHPRTE